MLIVILVIIGLSVLILGHEAGHFFAAKLLGMKIEEFGLGLRFGWESRIYSKKINGIEYSVNWLPLGGFVRIAGENDPSLSDESKGQAAGKTEPLTAEEKKGLFHFRPAWQRALVLFSGVAANVVMGWLLLSLVFFVGAPSALSINGIQKNSPAEKAGLLTGDIIEYYANGSDFIKFVNDNRGKPIILNVLREGKELSFNVVPRVETAPGEGAVGVELVEGGPVAESLPNALYDGLTLSLRILGLIYAALYQLVAGLLLRGSLLPGLVGPIGIVAVATGTSKLGFIYLVSILSQISLSLAVVNFIPFPALDGGQFFLILVEKIKGSRAFSRKAEAAINAFGLAFLIILILLISVRDFANYVL